jgi:hypothetical protein
MESDASTLSILKELGIRLHPSGEPNMRILLSFVFILAMAASSKPETKPEMADSKTRTHTADSKPAHWIQSCTLKLNTGKKAGEVVWFNGMGASDVMFMPKSDPAQEIFDECMRMVPLDPDKAKAYKSWLFDRVAEIESLAGKTRQRAETILLEDGGISTASGMIYHHSECHALKVRVEFETDYKTRGNAVDKDDKIKAVSKPYLGFVMTD